MYIYIYISISIYIYIYPTKKKYVISARFVFREVPGALEEALNLEPEVIWHPWYPRLGGASGGFALSFLVTFFFLSRSRFLLAVITCSASVGSFLTYLSRFLSKVFSLPLILRAMENHGKPIGPSILSETFLIATRGFPSEFTSLDCYRLLSWIRSTVLRN